MFEDINQITGFIKAFRRLFTPVSGKQPETPTIVIENKQWHYGTK